MLNPDMPVEGMDRQDYIKVKFGGDEQASERFDQVLAAGAAEGIAFNFKTIRRTPNTLASHRLIRWAGLAGVQDRLMEAIFHAYFIEGADIGEPDVLSALAGANGMDPDWVARQFADDADLAQIESEDKYARSIGIQGVPCFIIDRKYAIVGAQDPEVFFQVFDLAGRETVGVPPAG
jgi:predicted DsbA family dithiol-disulfide isomerase